LGIHDSKGALFLPAKPFTHRCTIRIAFNVPPVEHNLVLFPHAEQQYMLSLDVGSYQIMDAPKLRLHDEYIIGFTFEPWSKSPQPGQWPPFPVQLMSWANKIDPLGLKLHGSMTTRYLSSVEQNLALRVQNEGQPGQEIETSYFLKVQITLHKTPEELSRREDTRIRPFGTNHG
jgi:hypothetical protein